ncbi:DUF6518 family protein [Modestobacter caceresii]|uniref:DUF6518 family protein n=1 Tax=Modestobacter caceresii TaxID=1522368 RepID=UPI0012E02C03|nr:DUF6518 family protein [Modestobacter caceresii]
MSTPVPAAAASSEAPQAIPDRPLDVAHGGVDGGGSHLAPREERRPGLGAPVALGVAVLIGLAWGAATSGLQTVLPSPFSGLANAVSPWVAPAFVVGALTRRSWVAAVAGVLVCLGEVGGYYLTSMARDFDVNPAMVVLWVATGLVGGPVFGAAGWCWRRVRSLHWTGLSAALMGGVFLSEGAIGYGVYLHYAGDAVVFCTLGALLVVALGAAAPAAREIRAPGRGIGTAMAWLLLVLPLGAAGQALLRVVA